ncbi:MAG: hypothetical protein P1U61_06770 [Legionellaceae bacterium]|nr:hypothetical protein [Legionellaceae bacterium]
MTDKNSSYTHKNLKFFSDTISSVNTKRQKIRQTKGIANVVVGQISWKNNLCKWDPSLGLLSFTLYYTRLVSNITLLICQFSDCRAEKMNPNALEDIMLELLNDTVWSSINLVQFFWWTFKVSTESGLRGVQLEGVGMLFDEMIMLIQYQKKLSQYKKNLCATTSLQKIDSLKLEWQYKKFNLLRSSIHIMFFSLLFIGFGMGMITFSISICIYSTNIISQSLRMILDILKDAQQSELMKKHDADYVEIKQHQNHSQYHAMQQANHFIHFLLFVPLALILSAPGPLTLSIGVMACVFLSDYCIEQKLKQSCTEQSQLIELESEQTQAYAIKI